MRALRLLRPCATGAAWLSALSTAQRNELGLAAQEAEHSVLSPQSPARGTALARTGVGSHPFRPLVSTNLCARACLQSCDFAAVLSRLDRGGWTGASGGSIAIQVWSALSLRTVPAGLHGLS